jgi:WD40 repeat protein
VADNKTLGENSESSNSTFKSSEMPISWSASNQKPREICGHESSINSIAFSAVGKLASASEDKTVRVWDTTTGRQLQVYSHHNAATVVVISLDGTTLASIDERNVRMWYIHGERPLRKLDLAYGIAFSPDGTVLACTRSEKIMLHDTTTGNLIQELVASSVHFLVSVAFSPDGGMICSGGDDKTVYVWEVASGKLIRTLRAGGHENWVFKVAFSPDGEIIASAGGKLSMTLKGGDTKIRLWKITGHDHPLHELSGDTRAVTGLTFSSDGKIVASCNGGKTVKLWDVETGQIVQEFPHKAPVKDVAFLPNGRTLASCGGPSKWVAKLRGMESKCKSIWLWDSAFVYTPLDQSKAEIRVLNVHPGAQNDENIILSFDKIQLSSNTEPDFEAVSYRWGSDKGQHQISLDGKVFFITPSQRDMILDLRYTHSVRRLWIDALCIDQKNIPERSHQVQHMRKIYSLARSVCVWLNHEIDESSPAFQTFLSFNSNCEPEQLSQKEHCFWNQICTALNSEYFYRVWIQQELSKAKAITVQCRRTSLPTACILHFMDAWNKIYAEAVYGYVTHKSEHLITTAPQVVLDRVLSKTGNSLTGKEDVGLLQILHFAQELHCHDDRDLVYGMMSLAQDWHENDIIVDYSLSVDEVFKEAVKSLLQSHASLEFLQHVNSSHRIGSNRIRHVTPSWVPDWTKYCHCGRHFPKVAKGRRKPNDLLPGTIQNNDLITNGIKLTTVANFYADFFGKGDVRETTIPSLEFFRCYRRVIEESKYPEDISLRSEHLLWLLIDVNRPMFEVGIVKDQTLHAFSSIAEMVHVPQTDNAFATLSLKELRDVMVKMINEEEVKKARELTLAINMVLGRFLITATRDLHPFVSQQGRIGLAPSTTQTGDEIWLIPTCEQPIVLRPCNTGGTYTVIGVADLGKEDPWGIVGGMRNELTTGLNISGYNVKAICLK